MSHAAAGSLRQQLLVLYLGNSCLSSQVVAWAQYDGTGKNDYTGEEQERPYPSGLAALRDGWRVIKFPEVTPATIDYAYQTSVLPNEFVFEKLVEVSHG